MGFDSSIAFDESRIHAAAVYCSDGRWGEQMDDFLHRELGLPRYDRLVVPGGPAALAGDMAFWREAELLDKHLRFLIDVHALERVVLIAHQDCAFYTRTLGVSASELEARQNKDLAAAARRVRGLGPVDVSTYRASREGGVVRVEQVRKTQTPDRKPPTQVCENPPKTPTQVENPDPG